MVVVAIIGILAAIAIPAYNDYTTRAKLAEVLNLAGAGKTVIFEEFASSGVMPAAQPAVGTPIGDWLAAFGSSRYVVGVPTYSGSVNQAKVTVKLNASAGISGGNDIQFIYTAAAGLLAMECSATAANNPLAAEGAATTIAPRYLPGICR
jgi:type IV pilus assembly protein PilA